MVSNKDSSKQSTYTADKADVTARVGVERGVGHTTPFSTPFKVEADSAGLTPIQGDFEVLNHTEEGPSVSQLVKMRKTDGQARALYRLLTLPIRSALKTATFVPTDGGEKEAEFIEDVFRTPVESGGMTITFQRFMSQLLTSMFDGFSAFEKVFWIPETGPLKGKITLKKLAHRPAETITFVQSANGGFRGMRQRAYVGGQAIDTFIPSDYCFYYATQEEERKFYGVSFFETAFFHYDKKVRLYYVAHVAAQRSAMGTRVGKVPMNATDADSQAFSHALASGATQGWMKIPADFSVEVLKDGGSFDFLNMINHHNSQMSKSLLAQFIDTSQGSAKGDGALVNFAQPGDEMFILMLRAVMDDIADQINHYIIPQLVDLNFGSGKYPEFTWGTFTDEQRSALASVFEKIVTAGQSVNATPEFVRALEKQQAEELGLEIDYDEVEEREATEKEQNLAAQSFGGAMGENAMGVPSPMGADGGPANGQELVAEQIPEQDFEDQILVDGAPAQSVDAVDEDDLGLEEGFTSDDLLTALDTYVGNLTSDDDDDDDVELSSDEDDVLTLAGDILRSIKEETRG